MTKVTSKSDDNDIADLVRSSLTRLTELAPGNSVEVRVPPYGATQCIAGTNHRRGTPPNVVEMEADVWLQLVDGTLDFRSAITDGLVDASGSRAMDLQDFLPMR